MGNRQKCDGEVKQKTHWLQRNYASNGDIPDPFSIFNSWFLSNTPMSAFIVNCSSTSSINYMHAFLMINHGMNLNILSIKFINIFVDMEFSQILNYFLKELDF